MAEYSAEYSAEPYSVNPQIKAAPDYRPHQIAKSIQYKPLSIGPAVFNAEISSQISARWR